MRFLTKHSFALLWAPWLAMLACSDSVYAQDAQGQAARDNVKGFVQLDLSASIATRTVTEDLSPGAHFEGDADSSRILARLGFKPWMPVEIYAQLGAASIDIDEFNNFDGDYGLAYGAGFSLSLYQSPAPERFQFLLQGDALHFKTSDTVRTVISGVDTVVDEEIRWREYTIQGIGRWRVFPWEPYVGARFSWVDATDDLDHPAIGKLDLEAQDNIGLVAGVTLFLDRRENFATNFELTLIDQNALRAGIRMWY